MVENQLFHGVVVVGVASAAHAADDAVRGEHPVIILAGVRAALIGIERGSGSALWNAKSNERIVTPIRPRGRLVRCTCALVGERSFRGPERPDSYNELELGARLLVAAKGDGRNR